MNSHCLQQYLTAFLRQFKSKFLIHVFIYCILFCPFFSVLGQEIVVENFESSTRREFHRTGTVVTHTTTTDVPPQDGGTYAYSIQVATGNSGTNFFGVVAFQRPTTLSVVATDSLKFWIKADPVNTLKLNVELYDADGDTDGVFDESEDDKFVAMIDIAAGSGYQLISLSLNQFDDVNPAVANDVADFIVNSGPLLGVALTVVESNGTPANTTFNITVDYIHFTNAAQVPKIFDDFEGAVSTFNSINDPNVGDAQGINISRTTDTPPNNGGDFAEMINIVTRSGSGLSGYWGYVRPTSVEAPVNALAFYIKPDPNTSFDLNVELHEDEDKDGRFERGTGDDLFRARIPITSGTAWEKRVIRFSDFDDSDDGFGNGEMNFSGTGQLIEVAFVFVDVPSSTTLDISIDYIHFSKDTTVSVAAPPQTGLLPEAFHLSENYPNPFNPETRIDFQLARAGEIRLDVFNLLGQHIITLFDGKHVVGNDFVRWDGHNEIGQQMPGGIYFLKMQAGDFVQTRRMVLLK